MIKEINFYSETLCPENKKIATIFVGGGTPTCLMPGYLERILEQIHRAFDIVSQAEISIEANPGTVDFEKLKGLKEAGYNRLSLGVQSTHQDLLRSIGRIHSFREAEQAVEFARRAGFNNLNLDLIFGLPGQTLEQWRRTLEVVAAWRPEHLSCYGLQLEEGTPLADAVDAGKTKVCPEELELEMYLLGIKTLSTLGYGQYEISNFARPNFLCQHNLIYWHNNNYLGLGPAAHSFMDGTRFSNVSSLEEYTRLLFSGRRPIEESRTLGREEQMGDTIFLGLRLTEGLELNAFKTRFGVCVSEVFGKQIKKLQQEGLVELHKGILKLTDKGVPVANRVFCEFV
ncbi:hypothetical protein N752_19700 [Desulforamulus aquiferis]|nr:hypothetical protein N752_19700 [Desulforamulus aquiferis]